MPRAVDVFSGCGGLSTGLEKAGFTVYAAVEINPKAAATYRLNHENTRLFENDVRKIKAATLMRELGLRRGELDLLAGCSPCQGFSRLRKGDEGAQDRRNQLVFEFIRLVRGLYPKTILMENVPGLLNSPQGKKVFRKVSRELKDLGYKFDCRIIDTANYGIPQFRKRCVLLGSRYRKYEVFFPNQTHTSPDRAKHDGLEPWRTVRQTIEGLPPLENGSRDATNPLHWCAKNGELNRRRIAEIPHDGGDRSSRPDELDLQCHRDYPNGFRDVYGRMRWDSPSPTMTGGCTNITKVRFIHPEEDRGVSLLEAALFQTFPPNYQFVGSFSDISLQIGNAVPVELGRVMGNSLAECISRIEHA